MPEVLCGEYRLENSYWNRVIDSKVLNASTEQAKASPRLRMNMDLRNSVADGSQWMLNALESGTVMPIQRHRASSETVVFLRGKIPWFSVMRMVTRPSAQH